jgi:hypothetical protein
MEIMRVLFSIIILLFLPAAFAIPIAIDSTSLDSLSDWATHGPTDRACHGRL